MKLFNDIMLFEHEKASQKEIAYIRSLINKSYNEWRKISRRINAVDLITTTVNRINKILPSSLEKLSLEDKAKIAIILMRCMDIPSWKPIETKAKTYEKLFPLIHKLQNFRINTGTNGTLKEIICTRLAANIAASDKTNDDKVAVIYEPKFSEKYTHFLFGSFKPSKIYRMQTWSLPDDFNTLINILTTDLNKSKKKFSSSKNDHKK